jgi:hypothetical protein
MHRAVSTRHLEALASVVHLARSSDPHATNLPHGEHRMMRHEGLATFDHRGVLRAVGMLGSTALGHTCGSRPQTFVTGV